MVVIGLGGPGGLERRACADERGGARPAVRLELAACLDAERDAIQRAVRVELGDALDGDAGADPDAVAVRVECAPDGAAAGVVLEVRPPDSSRRYRYALDWRAQPVDARPRLVGLAVAEAVDASRIELTALPEPLPPAGHAAPAAPAPLRAASGWALALGGAHRAFSGETGVALLGGGLMATRRLSSHLRFALDAAVETATVLVGSGAIGVLSVSSAPRAVVRLGGRVHAEIGAGARFGVVRLRGEARPHGQFVGQTQVRPWLGPIASLTLGAELTADVTATATAELGAVVSGAVARELGEPVATLDGRWTALGLGVAIAL